MDWDHSDYLPRHSWDHRTTIGADFQRYIRHMKNQLSEILTHYGPIDVLWFDGQWEHTWTETMGDDLEAYVRSLSPGIIINNRVGKQTPEDGDYGTPEQTIPATGMEGDWETCMTMNNSWGYHQRDNDWKSTTTLITNLVDIASKGGNYLLNVGPDADGLLPQASVDRLTEMGQWIRFHADGESIYGTTANPFEEFDGNLRMTKREGKLYIHILHWPASGKIVVPLLQNNIDGAYMLSDQDKTPLAMTIDPRFNELLITLPQTAPHACINVVALEVEEMPMPKAAVNVKNVAFGKASRQSSNYFSGEYGGELAVNGDTGDFTHTDGASDANPWWQVDLGKEEPLERIKLFNRDSGWQWRLRDITVEMRDGNETVVYTAPVLNPNGVMGDWNFDLTVTLPHTINGRYIQVRRAGLGVSANNDPAINDDNNVLSLGEIEAYIMVE